MNDESERQIAANKTFGLALLHIWVISSTDRVALSEGVGRGSIPRWPTNEKPLEFQRFQGLFIAVDCFYQNGSVHYTTDETGMELLRRYLQPYLWYFEPVRVRYTV